MNDRELFRLRARSRKRQRELQRAAQNPETPEQRQSLLITIRSALIDQRDRNLCAITNKESKRIRV